MVGDFFALVLILFVLGLCFYFGKPRKKRDLYSCHDEASYMYNTIRSAYESSAIGTDDPDKAYTAAANIYECFSKMYPNNILIRDFDLKVMLTKLEYHFFEEEENDTGICTRRFCNRINDRSHHQHLQNDEGGEIRTSSQPPKDWD